MIRVRLRPVKRVARVGLVLVLVIAGYAASATWEGPPGLQPPTAGAYADVNLYRLEALATSPAGALPAWVEVTLGALAAPDAEPEELGLLQAIVEIYVLDGLVGVSELLPGSGLRLAAGRGWRDALRLTFDGGFGWSAVRSDAQGTLAVVATEGPFPLDVVRSGRTLRVMLPLPLPEGAQVFAISGVHDPFSASGWRALAAAPAPFAFAADEPGRPAIIDLAPGTAGDYQRVVETGELGGRATINFRGWELRLDVLLAWRWWLLTAFGVALFAWGVAVARRARPVLLADAAPPMLQPRPASRVQAQRDSLELIGEEEIAERR